MYNLTCQRKKNQQLINKQALNKYMVCFSTDRLGKTLVIFLVYLVLHSVDEHTRLYSGHFIKPQAIYPIQRC